jgi:integrase
MLGRFLRLKPEDIESNRKLIHIRSSKGRKDHNTLLSEVALQTLREYWKKKKSGSGYSPKFE